jgi:hypothetical protein
MEIIESQEEFDIIASQQCEINNGNSSDECTENWKAGYLYALQQFYDFRESEEFDDCFDYIDKTDEKINEYTYLEIF